MKNEKYSITAVANHSKRTFTIRCKWENSDYTKYRTIAMNKEEFQSSLHHTENDWKQFLKSEDYYKVK
jgi:formylmethanofuran dehydrogenase subunit E